MLCITLSAHESTRWQVNSPTWQTAVSDNRT